MWNRWKARADDFRVLDEDRIEGLPIHYGSEALQEQLRAVTPRYHLFGHVHAAYGTLRHHLCQRRTVARRRQPAPAAVAAFVREDAVVH